MTTAVAVLGTGAVGAALLRLLSARRDPDLLLVAAANSRHQATSSAGLQPSAVPAVLHDGEPRDDDLVIKALLGATAERCVIVDATASGRVASRHAEWLRQGIHVVTANKLATSGPLSGWHDVWTAATTSGVTYADAATVGAGLPVLSSLRRIRAAGASLVRLEAVLSGSLSWICNTYDGSRPLSTLLADANRLGLTEPDAYLDLSGEDARHKLVILARAAGLAIEPADIRVSPVPADDDAFAARHRHARRAGRVLRYLSTLSPGHAITGLVDVPPSHPAARLRSADNLFMVSATGEQPTVIAGPGAGPLITAESLERSLCEIALSRDAEALALSESG